MYVVAAVVVVLLLCLVMRHRSVRVYRFKRDWCHYCQKSQSEWNKFERSCWFSDVKAIEIDLENCSLADKRLAESFLVTSVPNVTAVFDSGLTVTHSGSRTSDAYHKWLESQPR